MCARPDNRPVPYYASSLVGRDAEISLLEGLVADPDIRLITITGPAGVGKTRLAVALVNHTAVRDALFVSLAPVREANVVLTEIGRAMGVQSDALADSIREQLATWDGVVVLDNFEQVIDAAQDLAEVIPHNPNLTIVVTSQRPLQLGSERIVRLAPLPVPGSDTELAEVRTIPSVQLLVNRAVDQDALLEEALDDASTAEAIAEICRRLDGVPLAIELAASRLASLTPEVVLAQLEQGQSILSTQRRDTPERHRTMHASISWSSELLPPETQRIFLWLGAFTAGFDMEIVQKLSGHLGISTPSYDTISELMNLSLIQRASGGANPWYVMLVSIREYCLTELNIKNERDVAEDYVTGHVLELSRHSIEALSGPGAGEWTAVLDRELPTIRSVIQRALAQDDPATVIEIATDVAKYMEQIGQRLEVGQWIDRALQMRELLPEVTLINGLITQLKLKESAREFSEAEAIGAEVGQLLEGKDLPVQKVQYLHNMGNVAQMQMQTERAKPLFEQTIALANKNGLVREAAFAHGMLGMVNLERGNFASAEEHYLQLRDVMVKIGDLHSEVRVLINLSAAANAQGDADRSLSYLDEALGKIRSLDHKRELVYILLNQSATLTNLGEFDAAMNAAEEAIQVAQTYNYPVAVAGGFHELCQIHLLRGDHSLSAAMAIRSLDALPRGDEDVQIHASLGVLMAEALAKIDLNADAAALLAKSLRFAEDRKYLFEVPTQQRIEALKATLAEESGNFDSQQERGETWSYEVYLRHIRQAARRMATRGTGLLVRIPDPETDPLGEMTAREREILELLVHGNSTQEMADQLNLSPRTVTTHIGNIMGKLGVSSRVELVATVLHHRNTE